MIQVYLLLKQKNPVLQPNNREHVDLTEQAPPKMGHEYAVVNKKNRKVSYVNLTVNKKASS